MRDISLNQIMEAINGLSAQMESMERRLNDRVDSLETKVDRIETKVSTIEKTTNVTQEHVARIDERTTQAEKLIKIFNMDEVERVIERAAK